MARIDDLSRSRFTMDPATTMTVVVELSQSSWLVAGYALSCEETCNYLIFVSLFSYLLTFFPLALHCFCKFRVGPCRL